ncbi:GINS complex, Sld5 component [Metschnikowia bicuspidata var. bicuspidata NRRL YB-4993]|uniref:DNA replication complex GINS protein SLD5 n=1 Tax=Metschnikowia bicuspidata var. bicuspidata NRRL YB-4993 TaxID=869754 RepID=A0A1A0HA21_9ASCO|nr:GINS complex, Sld5 component [Metschnikowia bicuspidata var. bicuspidata NRRL YB-4993]OBA20979.1 GINS complex, Sld5 component [Metschnikowia bicuspidata var. bicuspidata NRRL YB-4993]
MEIDDILADFEKDTRGARTESSAGLRQQLVTAMLNERMAPDLLPYKHTLMARILRGILDQQQFLLDSYEYGDSNAEAGVISLDFKLQLMIVETDIERLSYLVRLYIRTRLAKIDEFTIYYINKTAEELPGEPLLSEPEQSYMHGHFKILNQLYNNSFLKKFPSFLTLLDDTTGGENMITTPDLDRPVFIRVVCDDTIVLHLGNDELELVKDGIYVVRYRLIMKYLELGDVVLI